ncbi:hypothetical protein HQ36_05455 [Porphyromonas gingivicanis]|uniref:Uncharacterized protein n=1 Tax=Porphyromonas gingivicanis TaxID=266762 RepID=A0A0A2GB94_9PORP|nr:hypothetical protein HQ36_05455 [Porphyromonas gingivicanis]
MCVTLRKARKIISWQGAYFSRNCQVCYTHFSFTDSCTKHNVTAIQTLTLILRGANLSEDIFSICVALTTGKYTFEVLKQVFIEALQKKGKEDRSLPSRNPFPFHKKLILLIF